MAQLASARVLKGLKRETEWQMKANPSTTCFNVFEQCVLAVHAGDLIEFVSAKDKEFYFQSWFQKRIERVSITKAPGATPVEARDLAERPNRVRQFAIFGNLALEPLHCTINIQTPKVSLGRLAKPIPRRPSSYLKATSRDLCWSRSVRPCP